MTDNLSLVRADQGQIEYVRQKLIEYNARHVADELKSVYEPIHLILKNEQGDIVAGLLSCLCWNWVEVDILWVDEPYRHQGYGTRLLQAIEDTARSKGADFLKLNTFGFQAPEFYKKHGFQLLFEIDNAPRGSRHYYFMKPLRPVE
ncbi:MULTISPECIES: GNAT family N-acetyltransferase [Paenibacillus]|jgi:GNAT superfamily N-acetyltransferase|uniref:GNAT family N-acetyltransferase n=1 Tax=Paenibacillus oceani TaxID=2772510 RepID=A0A927CGZ7_9BACL|nr:GNAT family N-acetyltransferase [Paenibacillus oceani]MBD2866422.1 GNAT family N-acetyltransferase [Paenibacillus oceani]MDF2660187.1 histone acetyltransferase [Paenibacillus sp.]